MRALVARRLEGPDTLELIETPIPEPATGQVRIKVAAAAVNPVDLAVSAGLAVQFGLTAPREQFGLGWDVRSSVWLICSGDPSRRTRSTSYWMRMPSRRPPWTLSPHRPSH